MPNRPTEGFSLQDPGPRSLEYLAGVFDGEGCITFTKAKKDHVLNWEAGLAPKILMDSTHQDTIKAFHERFGGHMYERKPRNPKHRAGWAWALHTKDGVRNFVETMEPLLHTKRPQAEAVLMFFTTIRKGSVRGQPLPPETCLIRRLCYNKIRQANKGLWDNLNTYVGHGTHSAAIQPR